MRPARSFVAIAMSAAALTGTGAGAQTSTAQFAVRATVVNSCTITAVDMNFGTYTPTAASTASTPLTLKCTPGAAVTITLDGGGSGNPAARVMTGPATLGYQLYTDSALHTAINTVAAAYTLTSVANTGQTMTYTVYGQVPASQSVPAGSYVDTVHVTVSY